MSFNSSGVCWLECLFDCCDYQIPDHILDFIDLER